MEIRPPLVPGPGFAHAEPRQQECRHTGRNDLQNKYLEVFNDAVVACRLPGFSFYGQV